MTRRPELARIRPLAAVALALFGPAAVAGCAGDADADAPLAVATFEVADVETFKIELVTPEQVAHVRELIAGGEDGRIPNGVVVRDSPSVNAPWSWHIDPDTLEFADMTTEVCDGLPSDVEDGLITSDRYCPWLTSVVELEENR
jgi:hypothetical protein